MSRGKTVITYLVSGDSAGVKTIELSNWIGKGLVVPRADLKLLKERKEGQTTGIYFLFGKNSSQQNITYIGEAESLYARLVNHDSKKDFWEFVIAFVSKDNNLTKADVKYLESRAIQKAKIAKIFLVENSVEPQLNNLPEYQIDTMEDFLDNIELLISFLGFPVLTEVKPSHLDSYETLFCKGPSANATGSFISEGFLVRKDSNARIELAQASREGWVKNLQDELIAKGILQTFGINSYIFTQDYIFSSPSAAAALVLARSANGWKEWKSAEGKSLDELERTKL